MCLKTLFTTEQRKEKLKNKSTWLKVYKGAIVRKESGQHCHVFDTTNNLRWGSPFFYYAYKPGLNIVDRKMDPFKCYSYGEKKYGTYVPNFHSCLTSEGVRRINSDYVCFITCYVRKSWVRAMGTQNDAHCIVSKRIVMPKYPNKDLTDAEKQQFGIKE